MVGAPARCGQAPNFAKGVAQMRTSPGKPSGVMSRCRARPGRHHGLAGSSASVKLKVAPPDARLRPDAAAVPGDDALRVGRPMSCAAPWMRCDGAAGCAHRFADESHPNGAVGCRSDAHLHVTRPGQGFIFDDRLLHEVECSAESTCYLVFPHRLDHAPLGPRASTELHRPRWRRTPRVGDVKPVPGRGVYCMLSQPLSLSHAAR